MQPKNDPKAIIIFKNTNLLGVKSKYYYFFNLKKTHFLNVSKVGPVLNGLSVDYCEQKDFVK